MEEKQDMKVSVDDETEDFENEYFDPKTLKFNYDLSKCHFELDVLQNKLLEFYIRADVSFRRAFYTNYTNEFFQYIKDKARLKEPFSLSVMGSTRSGKSYSSIGLCGFHQASYFRKFNSEYICSNKMEFLEKIKNMPEEKTLDRVYLVDEEKNLFGVGSLAKRMRFDDVMAIIAKRNISTISLTPYSFSNSDANYGIRIFGRDFNNKICRAMLYNLQSNSDSNGKPLGMLYLPIFTALLPYAKPLEKAYLKRKDDWIAVEQRSEGDVLYTLKRKTAENILKNKQFKELKKKKERIMFIAQRLGSSWAKNEIEEIETITSMLNNGVDFDKE